MKTLKDWKSSGLMLNDFLTPGDEIDNELFDYFYNVLPPVKMHRRYVQIGEPHDHKYNCRTKRTEPTYLTVCNGFYCGICFLGETLNVEEDKTI